MSGTITYSIIMFVIAGILFVYSILLVYTGNERLLPVRGRTVRRNPRKWVRIIGESIAFVGYAPLLSGIMGLIVPFSTSPWPALIVLVIIGIITVWLRLKVWKKEKQKEARRRRRTVRKQQ